MLFRGVSLHCENYFLFFCIYIGQDGSYLTELLLSKGYVVYGLIRRSSSFNTGRIEHLYHDKHETKVRYVKFQPKKTDRTKKNKICSST